MRCEMTLLWLCYLVHSLGNRTMTLSAETGLRRQKNMSYTCLVLDPAEN